MKRWVDVLQADEALELQNVLLHDPVMTIGRVISGTALNRLFELGLVKWGHSKASFDVIVPDWEVIKRGPTE